MTRRLRILAAAPGLTVQDLGRPGWLARGLSLGGAADRLALHEGAALLGQPPDRAALELPGRGGRFEALDGPLRIALTGAPMQAAIDGTPLAWNASHRLEPGQILAIGAARAGNYGYLSVAGGLLPRDRLGARSAHLVAGLGAAIEDGDTLDIGDDPGGGTGLALAPDDRTAGGTIRILPSAQTDLFPPDQRDRLTGAPFTRNPRSNRMGVRLDFDGPPFSAANQHTILSEMVVPGDIQIAGDGTPFVLLYEHQTTGGYPRIATVIPADLPRIAQAAPGTALHFRFVTRDAALAAERQHREHLARLPDLPRPRIRDPHDIPDLLSYQLIGGVTAGGEGP